MVFSKLIEVVIVYGGKNENMSSKGFLSDCYALNLRNLNWINVIKYIFL